MTDPALLAQAKQGDPAAIAALMNGALRSQGIWARVEGHSPFLSLVLESTQAPDPERMVAFVRQGLHRLQPRGIAKVLVYGYALGETAPCWQRDIILRPAVQNQPLPVRQNISTYSRTDVQPSLANKRVSHAKARSPHHPPKPQPLVLKWSDFDPMLLAITGFIAIYGFLGSWDPSYDGPFMWLHFSNLAIHETGHLLFMPFGHFLMLLGGSLTQILFPAAFVVYFFISGQFFSSALTLFWTGQNFMDVGVYMRDAPARLLPLTVDNVDAHDWWQLFNMMNCLHHARAIANVVHGIGVMLYVASVIAGVYCAYRTRKKVTIVPNPNR